MTAREKAENIVKATLPRALNGGKVEWVVAIEQAILSARAEGLRGAIEALQSFEAKHTVTNRESGF